jgi:hypothetical protein
MNQVENTNAAESEQFIFQKFSELNSFRFEVTIPTYIQFSSLRW